uniref:Putative secreted protein n=1 Tax=Rhipicephalus microplus TaxID=6941 RepID=A0A6G5A4L2_RHIMP
MLLPALLLLPQAKLLSVVSCSLVGGYCTILAADQYLGTSLSYVVLNVVRRSLIPGGYQASNTVPFQLNDVLLSMTWAALFALGTVLQLWSERGRDALPPVAVPQVDTRSQLCRPASVGDNAAPSSDIRQHSWQCAPLRTPA